jgi:hypothetical protein
VRSVRDAVGVPDVVQAERREIAKQLSSNSFRSISTNTVGLSRSPH